MKFFDKLFIIALAMILLNLIGIRLGIKELINVPSIQILWYCIFIIGLIF